MKNHINFKKSSYNFARILFSAIVVIAIIFKLFDTEIGERIDLTTIGLFFAIFIPWFLKYISEFSILGVFGAKIHNMEEKITSAEEKIQSVANFTLNTQDELILNKNPSKTENYSANFIEMELERLGNDYIKTRRNFPSSNHRTQKMGELFREMVDIAKNNHAWNKYNEWLSSDRAELHLPAIAYLFAHPHFANISILIDIIEKTRQPFVQYWSLRVLQRVIDSDGEFSLNDIDRLKYIKSSLATSTDRSALLSSILSNIERRMR